MSQPKLSVEVISTSPVTIRQAEAIGWGENGRTVCIEGEVADIRIERDGNTEYSLRILSDGKLVLTSYVGVLNTTVDSNLVLTPSRLWTR